MKKAEIILAALALIAFVLRLLSIDGGVIASTLTLISLGLFYLLLSVPLFNAVSVTQMFSKEAYQERGISTKRILWAIAAGCIFWISLLGILFVLNLWQGAGIFWRAGMFLIVPIAAVSLIKHMLQPSPYFKGIAIRGGVILLAGLLSVALQL